MSKKKIVLGFSGGLDTSYCAKYLSEVLGYEVYSVTVNTGGFDEEELDSIRRHALALGVKEHRNLDATRDYYDSIIRYLIYGNVLKNNSYPLSVSAERLSQAMRIAKYALSLGIKSVAHGSTGAGNDQVRFDLILQLMIPGVEIITPIRDLKLNREQEIDFLRARGVHMNFEKARYSINKGLWGTSIGGVETLSSRGVLPEEAWPSQLRETQESTVCLGFESGTFKTLNGQLFDHPADAIRALQKIAGAYAIGRDIHVGDTIIGIKGRVGFEAAAPMVILKAHHALEKHVLTKSQLLVKDQLSLQYGNWLHDGQILDPVMRDLEAFMASTQRFVSGEVFVRLMPYRFLIEGVESAHDLMNADFGKYGEMNNGWTGKDVRGFTKITGNQTAIFHQVNKIKYD